MNMVSTIGAFVLGISVLVLLANIVVSLRSGELAGDNPWNAWTLEWATTSPPPEHNFERCRRCTDAGRSGIWRIRDEDRDHEALRDREARRSRFSSLRKRCSSRS